METRIERALISVYDKAGIEGFARQLADLGAELLSTGGTYKLLRQAGIAVREVSEYTGFPEMMDGRVKTLHPKVHGGILALRSNAGHRADLERHAIRPIDLVVVNLYPFERTAEDPRATREAIVEQIDIGGPAMVRSAAKNHPFVTVVTDPADYGSVLDELGRHGGCTTLDLRRRLAAKAFSHTARYDAAIAAWMWDGLDRGGHFPPAWVLGGSEVCGLRYGENPHQGAALYRAARPRGGDGPEASIAWGEVLGGKQLSYNNIVDLDAALSLAKEFEAPFACVVKHNNPCGAAAAATIAEALSQAWEGDPLSAFGSVLALTRPLDLASAEFLASGNRFVECIVAPGFEPAALEVLTTKPKWGRNVRLVACGAIGPGARDARANEVKPIVGGFLVQSRDLAREQDVELRIATRIKPTAEQLQSLYFAARVCKHVKSNAIVLAQGTRVVGVGAGQMSRVDAVHLAARKAGERAQGAALASDAFFPFPDGVEAAIDAGVAAILQPGGSVKDQEVVRACDARGVPMALSGLRHFRH